MAAKAPTIESVTSINEDGSRYFIHPADVRGFWTQWRRVAGILLLTVYILLPWIPVKGEPAVFLDVFHRKIHLFGLTLMFQDLWLFFFVITGLAFSLYVATSVAGRVFCGWACPQTVFLDHVVRRIERWIDGDATARRQLDLAPWTFSKFLKRFSKHFLFLAFAAVLSHVFLSYFVSLPQLYGMMTHTPLQNWGSFLFVFVMTGMLYFDFAWFREQFCIVLCPYGRFQSALIDDNSIVIGYDAKRGEPRGKTGATQGDCIDCHRCVQVCPTGIDIRQGLQLECISCAACIDACDEIMSKLHRPRGLIRHDSLNSLAGKPARFLRPRLAVYAILGLIGALVFLFSASQLKAVTLSVFRMQGAPYFRDDGILRNNFLVRMVNKKSQASTYRVEIESTENRLAASGVTAEPLRMGPLEEIQEPLILTMPDADYRRGFEVKVRILGEDGRIEGEKIVPFLGPFRQP